MIKIENVDVHGWEAAVRGMRNPMNSWEKSDSTLCLGGDGFTDCTINPAGECPRHEDFGQDVFCIGKNDFTLMCKLAKAGAVHGKFMRFIIVSMDIVAPLYFWKEFDTYKVGTVCNSCSTMHKIHAKDFTLDDFSHEHLDFDGEDTLCGVLYALGGFRDQYLATKDKRYWWQMIQLLPSSYNQRRTVLLNYEVLRNMYFYRKNHKLDEWREFCKWIETLPYSELITGGAE